MSYTVNAAQNLKFLKGKVLVAQLCPTLFNCMDCSQPGSSVHGILQARILEWVAIFSSRGSSQCRNLAVPCHRQILYHLSQRQHLKLWKFHSCV